MAKKTRGKTNARIVQEARHQRREPTPAEEKLWEALRGRRLAGLKFRRQHPYDRYILDMFCVEYQLEIEVDGGVHNTQEQAEHDQQRTECLEMQGIRVLRFSNEQIENDLDSVLGKIVESTRGKDASPPAPLLKQKPLQERGAREENATR